VPVSQDTLDKLAKALGVDPAKAEKTLNALQQAGFTASPGWETKIDNALKSAGETFAGSAESTWEDIEKPFTKSSPGGSQDTPPQTGPVTSDPALSLKADEAKAGEQSRVANLRALSGMKTIDQGSLSPQENATVDEIGKQLYGKDWTGSADQLAEVKREATWREGHRPGEPSTGGGTSKAATTVNPWDLIASGLTNQDLAIEKNLDPVLAGQVTPMATAEAGGQALGHLGLAPNSSAAQWLNSNLAAGQAQAAPLEQAMGNYEKAYQTGATGVDAALGNYGAANAAAITTAPEQNWLNTLVSHIQSNAIYGGTLPTGVQLTPALRAAYNAAGFNLPASAGTTGTPKLPALTNTSGTPPSALSGTSQVPSSTGG